MEREESPLDVLSRAATMVSPPTYDEARLYSNKEMPTGKWRRERRQAANSKVIEAPLDFSTRRNGGRPPPSYDQTIQNKMNERPSVIQTAGSASLSASAAKDESDDACDPAIDEHFRRSLGKDYSNLFSKDNPVASQPEVTDVDATSLSVDDHFAKALGDTWTKIKAKQKEDKLTTTTTTVQINNNNNHLVNIKSIATPQTEVVNIRKKKKKQQNTPKESMLNDKRRAVVTST